jgi:branched-chain amino acid aminotransferase
VNRDQIEEMGGMNIFFVLKSNRQTTLVTPKLSGSLLPGITRDSLLLIGPKLGYAVEERTITLDECISAATSGQMIEAFACGTAAVITPIGSMHSQRGETLIGDGQGGPVAQTLRDYLLAIQYGEAPDPLGWMHRVC